MAAGDGEDIKNTICGTTSSQSGSQRHHRLLPHDLKIFFDPIDRKRDEHRRDGDEPVEMVPRADAGSGCRKESS